MSQRNLAKESRPVGEVEAVAVPVIAERILPGLAAAVEVEMAAEAAMESHLATADVTVLEAVAPRADLAMARDVPGARAEAAEGSKAHGNNRRVFPPSTNEKSCPNGQLFLCRGDWT